MDREEPMHSSTCNLTLEEESPWVISDAARTTLLEG